MFFGLINAIPFAKSQNNLSCNKVITEKSNSKIGNNRF
jgi:hypothetical protein